ncbi:MAG: dUTP diphosphatase [Clostridia bacterium]
MKQRGFEVISSYKESLINLPVRKTSKSCGYDFESAEDLIIPSIWKMVFENFKTYLNNTSNSPKNAIKPTLVPTGVKSYFLEDEVLILANRSSGPIKKGLVLANSIGVIESDYYNNVSNEGHIMFAFYNFFPCDIKISKGDAIGQGFFQKFLVADNDNSNGVRTGGFGSTDK